MPHVADGMSHGFNEYDENEDKEEALSFGKKQRKAKLSLDLPTI